MSGTMKAASIVGHGGNEVVTVGPRPMPQPGPGEVRVRLHAATVNRVDLYMRDSGAGITHTLPLVMGIDGAGCVTTISPTSSTTSWPFSPSTFTAMPRQVRTAAATARARNV